MSKWTDGCTVCMPKCESADDEAQAILELLERVGE
jgi:hypothetical protein